MKLDKIFQVLFHRRRAYILDLDTVSKSVDRGNGTDPLEPTSKCRYVVSLIGFSVFVFLSVHRMNMTVSIVAMVNNAPHVQNANMSSQYCPEVPSEKLSGNLTEQQFEKQYGDFDWSPKIQGYILGSGFVGYFLTQFVAGKLSEIFGCKWLIFSGLFVASATTFVTPFVSWWNVYVLIVVQGIRGMGQGFYQSSISVLVANWIPVMERGSAFTFMMSGMSAGSVTGGLISGYLCGAEIGRWPSVFYTCGAAGILLSIVISVFLHENPSVHPTISETELKFILSNQESKLYHKRPSAPWGSIFSSAPIYALALAFFGQNWASAYFIAVHPTFLGTILNIPIQENGLFTSIPFLLQTVSALSASWLSHCLNRKQYVSVNTARKFWNLMSCTGYSICLLGIYFAKCNKLASIAFSFVAIACMGFGFAGGMVVPADMTPTFAGSVMGIVSSFGTIASLILPLLVGYLTDGMQTMEQWNKIMLISIGVVMSTGIAFCIFGSAEVQTWNYVEQTSKAQEKEKY